MTPRQMRVWLILARRHHRHRLAEQLSIAALGSRGEPKDLKAAQQQLED